MIASLLKSPGLFSVFLPVSNNVWMVSIYPPTWKSSSPNDNPLSYCTKSTYHNWFNFHLLCSIVFSIPWQNRGTYSSFHILSVLFCGQPGQQSRQFCKFSFFYYYKGIIIIIIIIISFFTSVLVMIFHWSLSESKSQLSTGFFAVFWPYHPWWCLDILNLTSNFPLFHPPLTMPLGTILNTPTISLS